MQDQTVPQNFLVTFDPLAGVDPLKIPAPAKTSQIADRIQEAFEAIDITVGAIDINLTAGTVAVEDTDGDVIERARIEGPGVGPAPEPDYWMTLADDLRQAGDRVATLAGTPRPTNGARLSFYCGLDNLSHVLNRPVVAALAEAFGATPKEKADGPSSKYEVDANVGSLEVWAYCYIPSPELSELDRLRAENARLQAALTEGGTR